MVWKGEGMSLAGVNDWKTPTAHPVLNGYLINVREGQMQRQERNDVPKTKDTMGALR